METDEDFFRNIKQSGSDTMLQKQLHKGCKYKKACGFPGSATVASKDVQTCSCNKCRYRCSENFPDDVTEKCVKNCVNLLTMPSKDFITNHVVEMPTKTEAKNSQNRQVSRAF